MELNRAFVYHKNHTDAEEEALERCGGDRELFCQIAKEMVTEALPDQVHNPLRPPCRPLWRLCTCNFVEFDSLGFRIQFWCGLGVEWSCVRNRFQWHQPPPAD